MNDFRIYLSVRNNGYEAEVSLTEQEHADDLFGLLSKVIPALEPLGYGPLEIVEDTDGNIRITSIEDEELTIELDDYEYMSDEEWDEALDEAEEALYESVTADFEEGDRVELIDETEEDDSGLAEGVTGIVVRKDTGGLVLVKWDNWHDGHGEANSCWWMFPRQLSLLVSDTDDYWSDAFDKAVKKGFGEPENHFNEGDMVRHYGFGTPERDHGYGGGSGVSLIGKYGRIIFTADDRVAVKWFEWNDGHGEDNSNWGVFANNLVKVN